QSSRALVRRRWCSPDTDSFKNLNRRYSPMAVPQSLTTRESRLVRVVTRLNVGLEHIVHDAFVFAMALTIIVFRMGVESQKQTPIQMIQYWAEGFWNFLALSLQMVLVVVTGHTVGTSPLGRRFIEWLARFPKNSSS